MLRVFITGASSGLGKAIAINFARQGALLGLVARDKTQLEAFASELNTDTICYALDVRNAPAMQNAAQDFITRCGVPDIIIASAGASCGNITEYEEDIAVFQNLMDINVVGMVKTFQPFVQAMRQAKRGKLVGIASVAGIRGLPGASAYSASKAAVISYLESLRVELHGSGVSVVTVCPGYIKTPMTAINPYPMPFILSAEQAANKLIIALRRNCDFVTIPWQMGLVSFFLKHMPNRVYDILFAKAPHKPRNIRI